MNNKTKDTKGMWRRTLKIFTQVRIPWFLYLLQIILGVVSTQVMLLLVPYMSKVQTGDIGGSNAVILGYIIYSLLSYIVSTIAQVPTMYASSLVSRFVRNRLVRKILRLPLREFEKHQTSALIARVTNETDAVHTLIVSFTSFLTGLFSTSMTFSAMTGYNTELSMLVAVVFVYAFFCYWLDGRLSFLGNRRLKKAFSEMTQYFAEHTSFFASIKVMDATLHEAKAGDEAIDIQYKAELYKTFLTTIQSLFGGSLQQIITIIVFVFGSLLIRQNKMVIEDLVSFYNVSLMTLATVSAFPVFYISLMQANGTLFYVGQLLDAKDEVTKRERGMDQYDSDIIFDNVSFAYGDTMVVKNVSFTIPKGKKTAIVGFNGSGKSTILKLIDRLYTPNSGEIFFGDINVKSIHLDEWRQTIGYMIQGNSLISGTIAENIAYGMRRKVSAEEIAVAARLAQADEFIENLPEKYQYQVGESGNRLSVGQAQRIAMARTLMVDPAYLLLDEATSNLDLYAKDQVLKTVTEMMQGRTTVIVSHQLKMIEDADQIIVMNQGEVEAIGTHEELLKCSETYRCLTRKEAH